MKLTLAVTKTQAIGCGKWFCLQRGLSRESGQIPSIIPLTEYLEYFENRQARKSMKLKAGDGDRTRDVQLGKLAFYR